MSFRIFDQTPPVRIINGDDGACGFDMDSMTIDFHAASVPLLIPPYPSAFFAPLGAILVQWGDFEQLLDEFLALVNTYNSSASPVPRSFKRRKERLKEEAAIAFQGTPGVQPYLSRLLADAASMYWKRNILAHGRLKARIKINKPAEEEMALKHVEVSIIGRGTHNGRQIEQNFTMIDLRHLFYAIANLSGRMNDLLNPDGVIVFSSSDIAALQAVRNGTPQSSPTQ